MAPDKLGQKGIRMGRNIPTNIRMIHSQNAIDAGFSYTMQKTNKFKRVWPGRPNNYTIRGGLTIVMIDAYIQYIPLFSYINR
jgi:hypothetical protein